MGWVEDRVEDLGDFISDAFEAVGDVIEGVADVIFDAIEFVGETVTAIIEDPLPTLLQIGGSMIGIPPYVTAAVITGVRGGDLEDIAKSAAISYASTQLMSNTQLGADIKNYTVNQFAGDFTDSMMENFNLTADQAVQVSRVATATLNSSLVGGINAALNGNSVMDGIASGFTSGLVYSSTDSYFDSLNKDPNWGFSPQALNLMKGATSTALNTIVSGKGDPAQAVGNYIAYAAINLGTSKVLQSAKDAYKVFMTNTDEAEAAQDKFTTAKAEYDTKIKAGEKLRNEINESAEDYKEIIDNQFTPFKNSYDEVVNRRETAINEFNTQLKVYEDNKWAYNNYDAKLRGEGWEPYSDEYGSSGYYKRTGGHYEDRYDPEYGSYKVYVADSQQTDWDGTVISSSIKYDWSPTPQKTFLDAANAAAAATNDAANRANTANSEADALVKNNQPMLDTLEAKKNTIEAKQKEFDVIKADVEAPNAEGTNTAAKLKAAADAYQSKYDAWSRTKEAADRSAENYTKALAEVATRDALIDTLNSGSLKVTSKDANGNWQLSNGMTLTTQGKFMQDGVQVFANAAGIPQKVMDFRANDGSNVDFDDTAGRLLSETDVKTIAERDFGFVPTDDEIERLAGAQYSAVGNNDITALADKKARDTYFAATGKEPTPSELADFRRSGDVMNSAADAAINGLDLPPNYVSPGESVENKVSFSQAYAANRAAYGPGAVFSWKNPKTGVTGQFTTESSGEQTKRLDSYLEDAQNRINLMPSVEIAGAGRGFLGGPPAGVEHIYYGKKDDNVYVDTRTFDAMGNVTGGSLRLADDKTATNVRATNMIEQLAATGAQGLGDWLKSYASAVSLSSGADMDSVTYRLGKTIDQWGKDRDGAQVAKETENMKAAVEAASKETNFFKQGQMIVKAAAENPFGMISFFGKEVIQETPGWAVGALGAAGVVAFGGGAGAVALTAAVLAAAVDGLESFGAGGREAYDALKKANVPEDKARDMAILNGGIHAAVTIPAEFIADKALFKAYLSSVTGGVKEYASKYGSTIATNAVSEYLETYPQVLSTQQITTGKTDHRAASAQSWFSTVISGGTTTMVLGPAMINDAAVIAKDYSGRDVSLAEFMSGSRDVDLRTLDSSATIGTLANGSQMTVGSLAAIGTDLGLTNTELKSILPSSITGYSSVVYKSADGTPITMGNIDSIVSKNPTLDFMTVLDTVYKTSAADFKVVFNPSVLSGTADLKPAVDYETMALSQGFPSFAAFQQYNGDINLYQNAQNNNLATAAGFPDYATYSKFNGDLATYNASLMGPPSPTPPTETPPTVPIVTPPTVTPPAVTPPVVTPPEVTPPVVTPPVVTPPVVTPPEVTPPVVTPPVVTPPVVTPPVVTPPDVTPPEVTPPTVTPPTVTPPAVTPPGVTMDAVDTAIRTAIAGIQLPAGVSMDSVVTAIRNFAAQNPSLNSADVTTAITNYMKNNPPISMDDVSTAMSTATKGLATKSDIATAIAGIKLPAGITKEDVSAAIEDYMSKNAGLSAADVTAAVKTYMDNNPGLVASDVKTAVETATKDFATKKDIENAIAGITFPAGLTSADVATQIDAALKANPGLSAADVTKSITDYMAANPGLSATDVSTAIDTATKDLVTNAALTTALSGVTADVKTQFDSLSQGQKDIIASQVAQGKDIAQAITDVSTDFQSKIDTLSGDVKTQFDTLTQGQKDIVASQVQLGVDVNTAITNAATQTATQIAGVKTDISNLSTDVRTKFDSLTQGQKDIVDAQVKMGVDINKAIDDASKQTTEQIANVKTDLTKNITDVQTQFNTRVDELVLQGRTYQEATQEALSELDKGVTKLGEGVTDLQKKEEEAAAAREREAANRRSAQAQAKSRRNLGEAMALIAPAAAAAAGDDNTPYRQIGLKTTGEAKFEGPLEQYLKMVKENSYAPKPAQPETQQQNQQVAPVQDELSKQQQPQENNYFNYGQTSEIDHLLGEDPGTNMLYSKAGGLATPLFAGGGTTRHGRYSGGGLDVVHHSGKPRLDFRKGDAVTGAGDGQSDDIPAMLADGEFVIPADVVAALGNGSTKAGSDKLYDMMHSIRAYHRAAKPKDLPPPAKKSPLDYLKKPASKARR
jgi:hypothetical protein